MAFVRPVTEGDAAQIVALLNDIIAQGTYTVMDEPLTIADQRAFIRTFPERGVFYAACALDGRLLGIQDIVPPASSQAPEQVGEISTFVRLDARGRGIGSLLTRTTFEAARLKGFERIRAMVRSDNA